MGASHRVYPGGYPARKPMEQIMCGSPILLASWPIRGGSIFTEPCLHRTMKTAIRFGRLGDLLFATGQHGWWRVAASAHLRFLHLFGHACSCRNPEKRLCSATAPVEDCVIISRFFVAGVKAWKWCPAGGSADYFVFLSASRNCL
jgi:hypothetical protein